MMTLSCPWPSCNGEVEVADWSFGFYRCQECGQVSNMEGDYTGEDSWGFWLLPCTEPVDESLIINAKEKDGAP